MGIAHRITTVIIKHKSRDIGNQMFSEQFRFLVKKRLGIDVGYGSYGYLNFPKGTKIGNYCSIAEGVRFLAGNHPMSHASTAAVFYNPALGFVDEKYDIERKTLEIGHDVWIGQNVLITNGCTKIGNGCVVGAGSIVTHSPPPYTIVAGNPARVLRNRFDDEIVGLLEKSRWWELSVRELLSFLDLMRDPGEFAKEIINMRGFV